MSCHHKEALHLRIFHITPVKFHNFHNTKFGCVTSFCVIQKSPCSISITITYVQGNTA